MDTLNWTKKKLARLPEIIEKFIGLKSSKPPKSKDNITVLPSVNISEESQGNFVILATVPGLTKDDLQINVHDNCISIASEKNAEMGEEWIDWNLREFNLTSFQRVFELPDNADTKRIHATLKNGILKIQIGKLKDVKQNIRSIRVE